MLYDLFHIIRLYIQKSIFNSGFLHKNAIFFRNIINPWFSVFHCTFSSIYACSSQNKLVSFEQEQLILFKINCEPGYPEFKPTYFKVQYNLIQTFKDLFICITLTPNVLNRTNKDMKQQLQNQTKSTKTAEHVQVFHEIGIAQSQIQDYFQFFKTKRTPFCSGSCQRPHKLNSTKNILKSNCTQKNS